MGLDTPGVEMVQLRRVEFQSGASLTGFEVKFFEFCNATQGEWAVKNLSSGASRLRCGKRVKFRDGVRG